MRKEPKKESLAKNNNVKPSTTVEIILDEITKKFIIKGKPLRIKSRHDMEYDWFKTPHTFKSALEMGKFVTDFVTYEMPELHKQFTFKMIEKVWGGIFDMFDFNNGCTTNGFKKRIIKKPQGLVPLERKRETLTIDEATNEILTRYDVDLAVDGSFLVFTEHKYNEPEPPIGGLGPVFRTANIIECQLGYCQPECELIIGVVHNLFMIAGKKENKPYLLPEFITDTNNKLEHKEDGK